MAIEDDVRSLDARVAKLTAAVEKSCTAQIESADWCSQAVSDVATLMADVRGMGRCMDALARAVERLTALLDGREELKTTAAYPVAAGAYDEDIARMSSDGATLEDIARWIGCCTSTVCRRRKVLGIDGQLKGARWTDREVAKMRELAKSASSWSEVADGLPGRTPSACKQKCASIGVRIGRDPVAWTEAEDAYIREHWERGDRSTGDMARELHRTEKAVSTRAYRLGVSSGARKKIMLERTRRKLWAREGRYEYSR